jgi:hypothetical protein
VRSTRRTTRVPQAENDAWRAGDHVVDYHLQEVRDGRGDAAVLETCSRWRRWGGQEMRLGGNSCTATTAHRGVVKGNLVVVHWCLFWLRNEEWGFGILRSQWPGARRRSACRSGDFCSNGKAAWGRSTSTVFCCRKILLWAYMQSLSSVGLSLGL